LPEKDARRWHRVRALADSDIDEQIKVLVTWYGADVTSLLSIAADSVPIPLDHLDARGKNWLRH